MESLSQLIKRHRLELGQIARAVDLQRGFDLTVATALLDKGRCRATTLGLLPTLLPTSTAASTEIFQRFLVLRAERGHDEAWDALANGEDGEEWCAIWDDVVRDRESGAVLTADQLTDLVVKARAGFLHSPRELLVVHREESGAVTSALLGTDWFS